MLAEASGIEKIILICGYTDLRYGIDGLAQQIGTKYNINGLVWEGTGFLLLYKRLEAGKFSWPRDSEEAAQLNAEQYRLLMEGINPMRPLISEVQARQVI